MRICGNKTWAVLIAQLLLSAAFSAAPFGAGCAVENLPGPSLFDVCKNSDDPCVNQAYAGERTSVALKGEHFNPAFSVDINNDDPPPLRGGFKAYLSGIPLEDVRRHSDILLVGTLPGIVPLGLHDVTVELPGGRRAGVREAFSIVDPLSVKVGPVPQRIPEGYVFELKVTLKNLGPVLLTQVTLSLSQEGTGELLLPADLVLPSVGAESEEEPKLSLEARQPGPATLLLDVSALAGGSILVGTREPLTVGFLVLPPAALVASAEVSPTRVDPGGDFELIVDVFNTGGTDALDVEVSELAVSGSGSVILSEPSPPSLDITAGSRRTIRFSGQAQERGTVDFGVKVQGQEAVSQHSLGPVDADSVSLEIR